MNLASVVELKNMAKLMKDDKEPESASAFLNIVDELKMRLSKTAYKKAINEIYA